MASIFLKDPVYITVQEVKDSTSKSALAGLTDDKIKVLIYKAEKEVDAYLGNTYRAKFDDTQEFLFPVSKEGISYLPNDIKEATLYVVEQVYESGDTVQKSVGGGEVKSETTGPHTITYTTGSEIGGYLVPSIAQKILDKYRNLFFYQVL